MNAPNKPLKDLRCTRSASSTTSRDPAQQNASSQCPPHRGNVACRPTAASSSPGESPGHLCTSAATPASSLRHSHPARSRPNSNRCSQDLCRRNKRVHRRSKAGEDATSQLIHGTGPRHDQCSGPGAVGSRGAARGPAPAGAVPAVETRQTPAEGQQK